MLFQGAPPGQIPEHRPPKVLSPKHKVASWGKGKMASMASNKRRKKDMLTGALVLQAIASEESDGSFTCNTCLQVFSARTIDDHTELTVRQHEESSKHKHAVVNGPTRSGVPVLELQYDIIHVQTDGSSLCDCGDDWPKDKVQFVTQKSQQQHLNGNPHKEGLRRLKDKRGSKSITSFFFQNRVSRSRRRV